MGIDAGVTSHHAVDYSVTCLNADMQNYAFRIYLETTTANHRHNFSAQKKC